MARKTMRDNVIARFDEKWTPEPNSGCFLWTGSMYGNNRYGSFRYYGKTKGAHRVSWTIHKGPIPDGLGVLHKCDVPCCVNPEHLFLGTHTDNMRDMVSKGRKVIPKNIGRHGNHARGERCGPAKLTAQQIISMREEFPKVKNGAAIARKYNISESQARRIISGESWRHI